MTRADENGEQPPDKAAPSRRRFLRSAGIATAGAVVGGAVGAGAVGLATQRAPETAGRFPALPSRGRPGFDHLVVVMYENRSFDNLLGYLYDSASLPAGQRFDGLNFGDYANPDPMGTLIPAHPYVGSTDEIMSQPFPDPGEVFPHVNTQLFDRIDPPGNAGIRVHEMKPPFNTPPAGTRPTMRGFVRDYIEAIKLEKGIAQPTPADYRRIMGNFTPPMLPVLSALARSFAVYDHWHCAVPSQTFCNRSFFHASTSHGFVANRGQAGYLKWFDPANASATIFNRLDVAGIPWRVYYDDRQLISLTGFIHAPALEQFWKTNFRPMADFYRDAERGDLPAYSFIEPRMLYDHNDMHPPGGAVQETEFDGAVITGGGVSDVRAGEALLHAIYSAIRSSANPSGSNALNTMLLVTFDEHGGTYDHVVPGAAIPPGDGAPGEMGFGFDRLGLRVPAIAISAYTARGTVINEPMHHSSVISTLTSKYRLEPLTDRDRDAPTLDNAINLRHPRQPETWPDTYPQYVPPNPESDDPVPGGADDRPLSPPGVGLVGMLVARYGAPGDRVPRTYREAFEVVNRRGAGLFGGG
ncbi:MAG: alkaline phosphatase family protein [Microbacteriaceae bacterium]